MVQRTQKIKYYLTVSISLVTFLVYLPALSNGFIEWDDTRYIVENPYIRSIDATFFRWSLLGFYEGNWHPLTWISHAADYAIWGLNPLGHHLTSVILHAINTALVVVLSLKLLDIVRERSAQNGFLTDRAVLIAAGVTGLLFGIHPVHVESVAWVSERKDLLCALFFLLSIMAYVKAVMRTGHGAEGKKLTLSAMLSALCFFVLALMSKPMAVSLPVALLILDWYPFGRIRSWKTFWSTGFEKFPFIALSLAFSVIAIIAQKAGGALSSIDKVPLSIRIPVAAKALVAYLGKMLLPMNLLPLYPYPGDVSLFSFEYLLAIVLVIGVTAACVLLARKQKLWLSSWGYYAVTLIPVLGIMQVGGQAIADRYTYLPSIAPFLIIGSMSAWALAKIRERWGPIRYRFFFAAALAIIATLSFSTIRQIRIWQDSITFWSYELGKEPAASMAYVNRGIAFGKLGEFGKAIKDYNEALYQSPSNYKALYCRGAAYAKLNLVSQAIADYSAAIALKPSYYEAYNDRGVSYAKLGQLDKAIADYDTAISLDPANYQAYLNRGPAYDKVGQPDRALADFDRAISLNPKYADVYFNRGLFFSRVGRLESALADFDRAISLNPDDPDEYFNRGIVFSKIGQYERAIADFDKAIALNPAFYQAYYNRGSVYQKTGQIDAANRDFMVWKEHPIKQ